jgi:hypothetical protein
MVIFVWTIISVVDRNRITVMTQISDPDHLEFTWVINPGQLTTTLTLIDTGGMLEEAVWISILKFDVDAADKPQVTLYIAVNEKGKITVTVSDKVKSKKR